MSHAQIQGFYDTSPLWKGKQFGMEQFVFPESDVYTLYRGTIKLSAKKITSNLLITIPRQLCV